METKRRNINKVWAILLVALVLVVTVFPGALAQRIFAEEAETVTISGSITWDDNDNAKGLRPESVTVNLVGDDGSSATATVTPDEWGYSFEGLQKYNEDGREIQYALNENGIKGYGIYVRDFNIINHYEEVTSENVNVTLKLDDFLKGRTGDKYSFTISAENGGPAPAGGSSIEIISDGAHDTLSGKFGKITFPRPANENGDPYEYTITQSTELKDGLVLDSKKYTLKAYVNPKDPDVQDGYEGLIVSLVLFEKGKDKIDEVSYKNSYPTTKVSVKKIWDDATNQDGKRELAEAKVQLYKTAGEGSKKIAVGNPVNVGLTDNWSNEWKDLAVYDAGKKITYSIGETFADGSEYTTVFKDGKESVEAVVGDSGEIIITNKYTPETTKVTVEKLWNDAGDQDGFRKDVNAKVQLYKTVAGTKTAVGEPVDVGTADDWSKTWDKLPVYEGGKIIKYSVEETLPNGSKYTKSGDDTILEAKKDDSGKLTITNSYTPEKTKVNVEKVWDDAENQDNKRPSSISVKLYADGEYTGKTATVVAGNDNSWSYEFTGLDKYKGGKEIKYTIEETPVKEYSAEITGNAAEGFTVKNTHTTETTKVKVTKIWDDADDQDGIRKDVGATVQLYKTVGEEKTAVDRPSVNVGTEDNWSYEWENLPVYENKQQITYSIEETLPDGSKYEKSGDDVTLLAKKDDSGEITITNSYTPEITKVSVEKIWDDADDQDGIRKDVNAKAQLFKTVDETRTAVGDPVDVGIADNWSHSWENLPVYEGGKQITYSIEETLPDGSKYEKSGDDKTLAAKADDSGIITITNTHTPEKTSVKGIKVWVDDNDRDGKRPESIKVKLLADGKETGKTAEVKADKDGNWTYEFTNLDKYKEGTAIKYAVAEEVFGDLYDSTVTGDADKGFVITNSYSPEVRTATVTKYWSDNEDQDGIRPESISVTLLANGTEAGTAVLNEDNHWTYTWTDLPRNEAGKAIEYTIKEENVPGYVTEVTGDADEGFVLTNTHESEKTKINVSKVWEDNEDQDKVRPDSITLMLLADGEETGKTAVITPDEDGNWSYEFADLDKFKDGKEIEYTIEETAVEGYTAEISKDEDGKIIITNTHKPFETEISVKKVWEDNEDAAKVRPEKITVKLLADGKEMQTAEIKADEDGSWAYEFTGLAKFRDGKEIEYTVEEEAVEWYETEITGNAEEGFVIKNTVKPPVNIKLTKELPVYFDADGGAKGEEAPAAGAEANATTVFRIKVLDKDGKALYENYFSFKFTEAGTQSEDIELPLLSGAATLTVEEVYSAGYASTGYNTTVDLTAEDFDSSKTIEVGFENTFDENRNRPGGTINSYNGKPAESTDTNVYAGSR